MRRILGLIATLVAIAAIGAILWIFPAHLVNESALGETLTANDRVDAIIQERRTILATLAALGAGLGLYYTHLRHRLDQDSNRTERYTAAIEQLGHDNIDVRLGGIYALERIAVDSERDSETITEVLSAFIREHSGDPAPRSATTTLEQATDVQAALTVIGRRQTRGWAYSPPADLAGANLTGANLTGADLTGADLTGADLTNAALHGANLQGVDLSSAKLTETDLTKTNLTEADLVGVDFTNTKLRGANLTEANLESADLHLADVRDVNLSGAILTHARLTEARLEGVRLTRADLTRADLATADLQGANLVGAILANANLTNANLTRNYRSAPFSEANLSGADLTEANLTGADLTGANLTGADLTRTNLTDATLKGANLTAVDLESTIRSNTNLNEVINTPRALGRGRWQQSLDRRADGF